MPEMLPFCGHRFNVFKHADYTCIDGDRRCLTNTVHLEELRCDGSAHHNCQAKCLLFWKEAWIKRIGPEEDTAGIKGNTGKGSDTSAPNLATALLGTQVERSDGTMRC